MFNNSLSAEQLKCYVNGICSRKHTIGLEVDRQLDSSVINFCKSMNWNGRTHFIELKDTTILVASNFISSLYSLEFRASTHISAYELIGLYEIFEGLKRPIWRHNINK